MVASCLRGCSRLGPGCSEPHTSFTVIELFWQANDQMFEYVRRFSASSSTRCCWRTSRRLAASSSGARVVGTAAGIMGKKPLSASTPHHMEDSVKGLARSVMPRPFIGCSLGYERVQNPFLLGEIGKVKLLNERSKSSSF